MLGDVNLRGNRVQIDVPFGISRIPKKNARGCMRLKFMRIVWFE